MFLLFLNSNNLWTIFPKLIIVRCWLHSKTDWVVMMLSAACGRTSRHPRVSLQYLWRREGGERHTAQWCVFNNFCLDKHRHQIWHHFYFSFKSWNNKVVLNFATNCHKKLIIWHLTFFSYEYEIPFDCQKTLAGFFFVKPWLLQQTP